MIRMHCVHIHRRAFVYHSFCVRLSMYLCQCVTVFVYVLSLRVESLLKTDSDKGVNEFVCALVVENYNHFLTLKRLCLRWLLKTKFIS